MLIKDKVYGKVEITEPVLIELINSKPVQRLKGINQAGPIHHVTTKGYDVTRYEHSIGVMILIKKLGGSLEEQIAGLLHDTPHTAFSHVIDYVFKNDSHEFHEKFFEEIIINSEIPEILKKYSFELSRILNEDNFKLLEKSIPDLCADRFDYALRDSLAQFNCEEDVNYFLENMIVEKGELVLKTEESTIKFANFFKRLENQRTSHPRNIAIYQIIADALIIALKENIITQKDLFGEDEEVYNKLLDSKNKRIKELISQLKPGFDVKVDFENYDFCSKNKLRYIDPKCLTGKRASELNEEVKKNVDNCKEKKLIEKCIKIISNQK